MIFFICILIIFLGTGVECDLTFLDNFVCQYKEDHQLQYANCSYRHLLTIPKLPSTINALRLDHNSLKIIPSKAFQNLRNLLTLDLSSNRITKIYKDGFFGLEDLQRLNLQHNKLHYNHFSFPKGIFQPLLHLNYLNVKFNIQMYRSPLFPGDVISDLVSLETFETDAYDSGFPVGFAKGFSYLTRLKTLRTGRCLLYTVNNITFYHLPYLEYLDLSGCAIVRYRIGTLSNRKNLISLDVSNIALDIQNLVYLFYDLQSSRIRTLKITHTVWDSADIPPCFFYELSNTGIKELMINENNFQEAVESQLLYCDRLPPGLEILDFSSNFLRRISLDIRNLSVLNLKNNSLGKYLPSNLYMNCNESYLTSIDLSFNLIKNLYEKLFHNQPKLRSINLSNNMLTDLDFDLSRTTNLKVLDVSRNNISTINIKARNTITEIAKISNLTINLADNILQCRCSSLPFLLWMFGNLNIFKDHHTYKCIYDNNTIVQLNDFRKTVLQLDKECKTYKDLIIGITVAVITSVIIITTGLIYRYRWKLRYIYYMTKSKYYRYAPPDSSDDYKYDAFISYSDNETNFIKHEVIPQLERSRNLTLCIHQRDFLPGEEINVNITNAIRDSKKIICILTRSFLESYYCMFEFNMARMESIYSRNGRNILFLVFYERLLPKDLPLVMLELVQQQSYIEYPHDEQGNVVFWEKLKEAIQ